MKSLDKKEDTRPLLKPSEDGVKVLIDVVLENPNRFNEPSDQAKVDARALAFAVNYMRDDLTKNHPSNK